MFRSEWAGNYWRRTAQKGEMGMAETEKKDVGKNKKIKNKKAWLSIYLAEVHPDQQSLKKKDNNSKKKNVVWLCVLM